MLGVDKGLCVVENRDGVGNLVVGSDSRRKKNRGRELLSILLLLYSGVLHGTLLRDRGEEQWACKRSTRNNLL